MQLFLQLLTGRTDLCYLLLFKCLGSIRFFNVSSRLAAIHGVGGDTGVKPQLATCGTVPHHHFLNFL